MNAVLCCGHVQAARRRKAPLFGSNKKSRELDRRQTLERVAAQRAALAASRVGLPGRPVLLSRPRHMIPLGVNACHGPAAYINGPRKPQDETAAAQRQPE